VKRRRSRAGQIAIFLVLVILALALLMTMEMDVFLAVRGKNRIQNAGDAAALAAARWQGHTLDLLGALNLAHLAAACRGDTNAVAGIVALQERLAYAGPLLGLAAADRAARENGAPVDAGMTRLVREAAASARAHLPATDTWPAKPDDYANILGAFAAEGLAAGADNAKFFTLGYTGNHVLYDRGFYEAVASENWCWFWYRYGGEKSAALLLGFSDWGDVPPPVPYTHYPNPEFFGVNIDFRNAFLGGNASADRDVLLAAAEEAGLSDVTPDALEKSGVLNGDGRPWCVYETGFWRPWREMARDAGPRMPLRGDVKPEYDCYGCAAACRVHTPLVAFSRDEESTVFTWTAAAKPFGCAEQGGPRRPVTETFSDGCDPLVLPAFDRVRLIPLGGVGEGNLYRADDTWIRHVRDHVPANARAEGCSWCAVRTRWDDAAFRRAGGMWLLENGKEKCTRGSGSGPEGGTRHAH